MMKQTKMLLAKIWWLGRATATVMGVAVLFAVVLGVATTALAAVPGDPFKLGQTNTINNMSTLVGSVNNAMLKIDNYDAGGSATALDLRVEPGQAPMKVDSGTKVDKLNADKLDGKDESAFLGTDEQAASAANSDELNSFEANELVRVAYFADDRPLASGSDVGKVATTKINAPSKGFLVIDASSDFLAQYRSDDDLDARNDVVCRIKVDDEVASGSRRFSWITSGMPTATRIVRPTR
jgi:hypothetical protein